jgi:hypothetical protein
VTPIVDLMQPGLALRPPSPAHLSAAPQPNGDIVFSWVRRSRDGWRWVDGVDAPLVEEQELYVVTLTPSNGAVRTIQTTSPAYTYSAAAQANDKAAGVTTLQFSVAQIGTMATSLVTTLTINLN